MKRQCSIRRICGYGHTCEHAAGREREAAQNPEHASATFKCTSHTPTTHVHHHTHLTRRRPGLCDSKKPWQLITLDAGTEPRAGSKIVSEYLDQIRDIQSKTWREDVKKVRHGIMYKSPGIPRRKLWCCSAVLFWCTALPHHACGVYLSLVCQVLYDSPFPSNPHRR